MMPQKDELLKEVAFKTSRSGGKGGQNVNKVSSKVEVIFNVADSQLFNADEKEMIQAKLAHRLDSEGNLHVVAQEDRSQLLNKQRVLIKLIELLSKSLIVQKERKATKVPKSVIYKRLDDKKLLAMRKAQRKKPNFD